jgi:predicted CoA-binding protein
MINSDNRVNQMDSDSHSDSEIKEFYRLKNIAVVGMSKNEEKPAHQVPKYLIAHVYNIIPVNPTLTEVLWKKSYPSIEYIPEKIDIVDVFRRSEDVPAVIDDAIRKKDGIKVIWMQIGIYNEEAEKKAKENGIDVVYNRCMMEEHKRLFAEWE